MIFYIRRAKKAWLAATPASFLPFSFLPFSFFILLFSLVVAPGTLVMPSGVLCIKNHTVQ
jgi:hypothetical protein